MQILQIPECQSWSIFKVSSNLCASSAQSRSTTRCFKFLLNNSDVALSINETSPLPEASGNEHPFSSSLFGLWVLLSSLMSHLSKVLFHFCMYPSKSGHPIAYIIKVGSPHDIEVTPRTACSSFNLFNWNGISFCILLHFAFKILYVHYSKIVMDLFGIFQKIPDFIPRSSLEISILINGKKITNFPIFLKISE